MTTETALPNTTKLILESFNWKSINLTQLPPNDIEKLAILFVRILEENGTYDTILLRDWLRLYIQHTVSDDIREHILDIAENARMFYKIFRA